MTYNGLNECTAYIALDIETTGLDAEKDRIIELAVLKYVNECIVEEFVTLVNPGCFLPPIIKKITGITDEMLVSAPPLDDVFDDFVAFLGDFPLVIHNADFDMGFINKACKERGLSLYNPIVDTLTLCREMLPGLKNHKLVTIKEHLGIRSDTLHRAKADAYVCGEILKKTIAYLSKKQAQNFAQQPKQQEPMQAIQEQPMPSNQNIITVTQLNKYIKGIIEKDSKLFHIMVKGELSNFKKHFSGHCYMTLKDETSAIRAIMFKGDASKLRFEPENGMKVIVVGNISVFERDGQYQLYLSEMQPDGVGDLHVAFEQLKEKLKNEGLFDPSRKKAIPSYPKAIGVVTSATGAAVRDIINVITRRYPLCEILIYPAQVQGEGGSQQVETAIAYFNEQKNVDVLIVGRGGGSIEELWVFNEERTARAIAKSNIPIISAVGHETDFTIADFVSDLRAPTPSAAAELAVPSIDELKTRINSYYNRMKFTLAKAIESKHNILKRFALKSPMDLIGQNMQRLDQLQKDLVDSVDSSIQQAKSKLSLAAGRLDALSPLAVLQRGYSVVQDEKGDVIRSVKQIKVGDNLRTKLPDGVIKSVIEEIVS